MKWKGASILEPGPAYHYSFALNTPVDKLSTSPWHVELCPDTPGSDSTMKLDSSVAPPAVSSQTVKLNLELRTKGNHAFMDDISQDLVLLDNGNDVSGARFTATECDTDPWDNDRYCFKYSTTLIVSSRGSHALGIRYIKAASGADKLGHMADLNVALNGDLAVDKPKIDANMKDKVTITLTLSDAIADDISNRLALVDSNPNLPAFPPGGKFVKISPTKYRATMVVMSVGKHELTATYYGMRIVGKGAGFAATAEHNYPNAVTSYLIKAKGGAYDGKYVYEPDNNGYVHIYVVFKDAWGHQLQHLYNNTVNLSATPNGSYFSDHECSYVSGKYGGSYDCSHKADYVKPEYPDGWMFGIMVGDDYLDGEAKYHRLHGTIVRPK